MELGRAGVAIGSMTNPLKLLSRAACSCVPSCVRENLSLSNPNQLSP
jgi:hypothetical protein